MAEKNSGSVVVAMLWMFFLSILLFWIPVFGVLLAGIVGGKKAGGVGSAILAVFLPALILGVVMFVFASVFTGFAGMGLVAGLGGASLSFLNVGPLLFGAIIGGIISD